MDKDWERLGTELVRARVRLGFPKRLPFARTCLLRDDRVMADLEKARRTNYRPATLSQAEAWYGLQPGNIDEILHGGPPRYQLHSEALPDFGIRLPLTDELMADLDEFELDELVAYLMAQAFEKIRELKNFHAKPRREQDALQEEARQEWLRAELAKSEAAVSAAEQALHGLAATDDPPGYVRKLDRVVQPDEGA